MTQLSINKVATIRNARGGNIPNVKQFAIDCERGGTQGITVHLRPDERHIRYVDVYDIKPIATTEFNIDANPKMIDMATKTGTDRVELYTESYAQTIKQYLNCLK
jgi:pyridoxine 5-phosphate synthase